MTFGALGTDVVSIMCGETGDSRFVPYQGSVDTVRIDGMRGKRIF